MTRKAIPPKVQADVVTKSKRRCALCVFLDRNEKECRGQIAHLNRDHSDNRFENLVWLCLEHHDQFDSKTSQTKNYTKLEVKNYRDSLYQMNEGAEYTKDEIKLVQDYIRKYSSTFKYIFDAYDDLAFEIHRDTLAELRDIRDFWRTNNLRSFNTSIRKIQDQIAENTTEILSIYEIHMYDLKGNWLKLNNHYFVPEVLKKKKEEAINLVAAINFYYKKLEEIAVT